MAIEGYPTIVVIEDDLDLRDIYASLLDHSGFSVAAFSDGQSALGAIASGEVKAKLILLDYMLPGMSGSDFLNRLAEQPNIEKIPTILISALSGDTEQITKAKTHPWIIASFTKTDITNSKLIDFVKAYFGLS